MLPTNRLVIVGGPSAVGKTTFLDSMQQGEMPDFLDQISISNPDSYLCLSQRRLLKLNKPFVDKLFLHYDFIHKYAPDTPQSGLSNLSDMINRSNSVCALTLCAPQKVLFDRITSRLERIKKKKDSPSSRRRIEQLEKKKEMYNTPEVLFDAYQEWLNFIEECGVARHMIINSTNYGQFAWLSDSNEARGILENTLAGQGSD